MSKFFEGIQQGLKDAIECEKGAKILKTHLIELPESLGIINPLLFFCSKEELDETNN